MDNCVKDTRFQNEQLILYIRDKKCVDSSTFTTSHLQFFNAMTLLTSVVCFATRLGIANCMCVNWQVDHVTIGLAPVRDPAP